MQMFLDDPFSRIGRRHRLRRTGPCLMKGLGLVSSLLGRRLVSIRSRAFERVFQVSKVSQKVNASIGIDESAEGALLKSNRKEDSRLFSVFCSPIRLQESAFGDLLKSNRRTKYGEETMSHIGITSNRKREKNGLSPIRFQESPFPFPFSTTNRKPLESKKPREETFRFPFPVPGCLG